MTDRLVSKKRLSAVGPIVKAYRDGLSINEVARSFGLSHGMVARLLDVSGVKRRSTSSARRNYETRKREGVFVGYHA